MMLMPRRENGFNFFDDVFTDPFFYEKENKLMKTDIREKDGNYLLEIDIPGYEKENIQIELKEGYLKVTALKNEEKEEKDLKYLRKERFSGVCSRSYYVGDDIKEDDIKANFKNGILNIIFPKVTKNRIEEKKYIQIDD